MFRDSYIIYIWVMNILCTFHIFISGYVTQWSMKKKTNIVQIYHLVNSSNNIEEVSVATWEPNHFYVFVKQYKYL